MNQNQITQMVQKAAQMMGVKDQSRLNNATNQAMQKAQSSDPLSGVPKDFLQNIRSNIDNPIYMPLFKMFGLNKQECINYLDQQLGGTPSKTTNQNTTMDKYKKGLDQLK